MSVMMARGSSERRAPRGAPGPLGELAPAWAPQSLHKALQDSSLDREESHAPQQRPFLPAAKRDGAEEAGWVISRWEPPVERPASPARGAGIGNSARRLMALERRRMRRSTGANSGDRRPRTLSRAP
jgi:hypothetical protein